MTQKCLASIVALMSVPAAARATDRAEETKPNIVWINAEDMSPHLGCYGHPDAHTPTIDALAAKGIVYRNAFATAPICSPARSCLATGLYATSLGTQHLRCEVEIPDQVVPLAVRLRELGYFCTNTGKSDYNFDPNGIWDVWSSEPAPWRQRNEGQPFFAFLTVGETHEGRINFADRYQAAISDLPPHLKHDPERVTLPPFYPDTPEIRQIFARMHDLATVFDRKVGELLEWLKQDGDLENTIVFVFGDHGNGLPRYKRWLNDSGLRVPLVVYVPKKYRHLSPAPAGTQTDRIVSFVDFPATALRLAGSTVPKIMQGKPFLGPGATQTRELAFGARSRADDMFEVSRSVYDGRYFYVRHFMPHLPYIQSSVIFDNRKDSFRELRKLHLANQLNVNAERIWAAEKPVEELYDLQTDPHELDNLAESEDYRSVKRRLSGELRGWILEHRDSGFLPEAEYQIRAAEAGLTPYEVVQDPERFDLKATLEAALRVGSESASIDEVKDGFKHPESGVRYWSAVACQSRPDLDQDCIERLVGATGDRSPSVRIAASQAIVDSIAATASQKTNALDVLGDVLQDDRPWVALEAARSVALLGAKAKPLVPVMKLVIEKNRSAPGASRPYKDFNYASFTGWALETALRACGEAAYVESLTASDTTPDMIRFFCSRDALMSLGFDPNVSQLQRQ